VVAKVYCGIDWAEHHHDIALIDADGKLFARKRIGDSAEGFAELLSMLADAGDNAQTPIPVAIETPHGLLVAALRETGRRVYAINPLAVARYRDRHTVSRGKSDHADAMTLANILRTDEHVHRPLPQDSELARAIAVLARAHQDATWRRTQASNELRSVLREYYVGFLAAFEHRRSFLISSIARAVLAIAPTPTAAATITKARIVTALRRAGRQRQIDSLANEILTALRQPQIRQPALVEEAFGAHALTLLAALDTACSNVEQLGETCAQAFTQHPDYEIITSFPGLSDQAGARILAELGDDRHRFADARAVKAYAGAAPITRASGRSISITHRRIKNNRLAATGYMWALSSQAGSTAARQHYKRRRDVHGDHHPAALRNLFNRFLGCLFHCLQTGQTYDETKAFAANLAPPA
jgi:transposase